MKKQLLAFSILAFAASAVMAQAPDTLAKIKERGAVNLGVRDSSGLAFTLGGGKYVGCHTEMAERIVGDLSKDVGKPLTIKLSGPVEAWFEDNDTAEDTEATED